jgi:MarR family transcriptional regulator, 2-MHQ and catechol-resistance regulon repressor
VGTHYRGRPAEVRALDLFIKLNRCAAALGDRLEGPLKAEGVTPSQFGLLEALLHLGPLEPCELGPKLLTSRPNVVLIIDQLERRGLVRRVPVLHDRRRVLVELTPRGRREIEKIFTAHVERLLAETSRLSAAEQEELARLCRKLGKR